MTFSLSYKCFQLLYLVSKTSIKLTAIIVSGQYGEQMQQMNKVSYLFENGSTFGFFDQDFANLTNALKYSNVNFLNFKPFAPKQLIWARQLGTEIWSKIKRRTRVQDWNTPAEEGHACKNAIRGRMRDTHAGYACGSGICLRKRDTRMRAGCACCSGIPVRERDRPTRADHGGAGEKHACSSRSIKIYWVVALHLFCRFQFHFQSWLTLIGVWT